VDAFALGGGPEERYVRLRDDRQGGLAGIASGNTEQQKDFVLCDQFSGVFLAALGLAASSRVISLIFLP